MNEETIELTLLAFFDLSIPTSRTDLAVLITATIGFAIIRTEIALLTGLYLSVSTDRHSLAVLVTAAVGLAVVGTEIACQQCKSTFLL